MKRNILLPLKWLLFLIFILFNIVCFHSNAIASEADSFRFPVDLSDVDGNKTWLLKENGQKFGSLNFQGIPHTGEDWNWGGGIDDYGKPVYSIANGRVKKIWNTSSTTDGWGKSILIEHKAPSGKQFITGAGYFTDTVYSFYAHLKEIKIVDDNGNEILVSDIEEDVTEILKGWKIGEVGDGNGQWGSHLHFEIRLTYDQNIIIGWNY